MLFRALLDRLFGTNDSQNWTEEADYRTARFSYDKFPNLLGIVERLLHRKVSPSANLPDSLNSSMGGISPEAVFPALHILQRAPPPPEQIATFRNLTLELLSSPQWHVRDMAARTYARLVAKDPPEQTIQTLLEVDLTRHNRLHGNLLAVQHIIKTNRHLQGDNAHST